MTDIIPQLVQHRIGKRIYSPLPKVCDWSPPPTGAICSSEEQWGAWLGCQPEDQGSRVTKIAPRVLAGMSGFYIVKAHLVSGSVYQCWPSVPKSGRGSLVLVLALPSENEPNRILELPTPKSRGLQRTIANNLKVPSPRPSILTTFEPSNRLAGYLVDAVAELRETENRDFQRYAKVLDHHDLQLLAHLEQSLSGRADDYQIDDAKEHLRKSVKRLIDTLGRGLQGLGIDEYELTRAGGKFVVNVRDAIFERMMVRQYDAKDFLERLYMELKPVARCGEYGGLWGRLHLCDGELCLQINSIAETRSEPWTKAIST
ncbi:hypothetical protein BMS3Bbin12_00167 [bacterium BMS3Bbin12]|nr:hypothetical protein BMS3Bbin12_00167 [bacterium BMS3Bbin12]GBE50480.1 hypothetical protein BMS3Bbin13_01420 [bacterium BMS3Bbin13]